MSDFYEIDSTKVSHREYWWGNKSPLVVIGWILKWLRIRLPSSTDDPNVDSTLPFTVSSLPDAIIARFLPLAAEFSALGFHSPVYHVITDPGTRTTVYWATFLHASGQHFARIHHRIWQQANSSDRGVFALFFTPFADGTFLVSSSGKPDLDAPATVQMNRMHRAAAGKLWQTHEQKAAVLASQKMPLSLRTSDALLAISEQLHILVRDFHLSRGVFRPRTTTERASADAFASSVAQAQQSGLEHAGAIAEMERLQTKKPSWANALWLLAISLVVFLAAGASQWDWKFTLWLAPALLLHELGHWIAMRTFHYRNLRMFFIPFFGAAVTGQNWNVPGWKKALVSLAGPVPGIFLGVGLAIAGLATSRPLLSEGAIILLFLNGFNLLPVLPLDGGHVLHATLFCRNRWLDITFRVIAVIGLLAMGAFGFGKMLTYIAIPLAIGLPMAFKLGKVTDALRKASLPPPLPGQDVIPAATAQTIIAAVKVELPKAASDKAVAQHALNIFETLNAKPPSAFATFALLILHGGSIFIAIGFAFLLIVAKQGGGLGGFLSAAVRQPKHQIECQQTARWQGEEAGKADPNAVHNVIIASFEKHEAARNAYTDLSQRAPTGASLTFFGESILLALPSNDDAEREKWFGIIQDRSTNLFVALTNRPVGMSLTFIAPSETISSNIVEELDGYFNMAGVMPLIPPWAPDAQKAGFEKYSSARKAWSAIGEGPGSAWTNPSIRSISAQMTAAARRGAAGEMKRLSKEHDTLLKEATDKTRGQLRQNPPHNADQALVDLYFRMTDMPYTNRAERTALYREIAPRLGQIPHEGSHPSIAARSLSATYGAASRHGLLIEIRWMGLADPTKGAPALLDWICGKGCRQIKYDFEGSHSFGGLGDDE